MKATRIKPTNSLTLRERRLFNRIVSEFPPNFYAEVDRCLLESFCFSYFSVVEARKRVRRDGPVITGSKGTPVRNPDSLLIRDETQQMASLAVKLRLSASTRLLKDHMDPGRKKVRDRQVYDPDGIGGDWKTNQRLPEFDS